MIRIADEVTAATREAAAHHEAGHAVVAMALGWDVHGSQLGRLREDDWFGHTDVHGGFPRPSEYMTVLLGGGAGEGRHYGSPETWPVGCGTEWEEALGLADRECSGEAREVVAASWTAAKDLVAAHEATWSRFAAALIAAGALGAKDCRRLLAIPESAWIERDRMARPDGPE